MENEQDTLTIREMTAGDHDWVLPRVTQFYTTGAVEHPVDTAVLERTFSAAVSDNPRLAGYILCAGETLVGYSYLTFLYSTEAGECVMIEELYLDAEQRGKGYGTQFFSWLRKAYPTADRFRLEVTESNSAAKLYRRVGFELLEYNQMILEPERR
mgnify:CR=1 FL=1